MKIINQINSSDENTRHDSPTNNQITTTMTTNNLNGTAGGRVRRKSSHNAIEKRYRSSINERILELKEIVADNDEKVIQKTKNGEIFFNDFLISIRYKNRVFYDGQLNIFVDFNQLIVDWKKKIIH